jgi:hypothetical protein
MSYFAEVTHTECVNRMAMVANDQRTITKSDQQLLDRLPSAIEEYLARGGKVTTLQPMAMQDPQSEAGKQGRIDSLRQYDRHREIEAMKAAKRG